MCGIFGVISGQSVTQNLITGLRALSYRGYDSAGIAVIGKKGLQRRRAQGKLSSLETVLKNSPLEGMIGIAHTRWATHGAPTKHNAHPHMTSKVAVVHNGIVENYQTLRNQLETEGYSFKSNTDSETIPLLITRNLDAGLGYKQSIYDALSLLEGSFAIAVVFNDQPNILYAARQGSPLVIGVSEGGFCLASDANAFGSQSNKICHLQDGDLACIACDSLMIIDSNGHSVIRAMHEFTADVRSGDKDGYRHYMQKEICEQPAVLKKTVVKYLSSDRRSVKLPKFPIKINHLQRISIIACGTSNYAGMVGKYWLESFAGLPVELDIASEYRYRNAPLSKDGLAILISQSGETADTLAALQHAKKAGQKCLSIINVLNSTIAKESDGVFPTYAGTEIGVASTKAFTAQLTVLLMLTLATAKANQQIDDKEESRILNKLQELPEIMHTFLNNDSEVKRIASKLYDVDNILYLGRGIAFPLALEGALKLKEISYIHAEAYPAGELKHGPIALIDENMPVVMIAPPGKLFSKSLSNLREVSSRGAKVILVSNQAGIDVAREFIDDAIVMPDVEELFNPILYALPLQQLAYHVALLKGTDVDQPRNLAKSVTVE